MGVVDEGDDAIDEEVAVFFAMVIHILSVATLEERGDEDDDDGSDPGADEIVQ